MEITALRKVTGPEGTEMAFAQLHTPPPLGSSGKSRFPKHFLSSPSTPHRGPVTLKVLFCTYTGSMAAVITIVDAS